MEYDELKKVVKKAKKEVEEERSRRLSLEKECAIYQSQLAVSSIIAAIAVPLILRVASSVSLSPAPVLTNISRHPLDTVCCRTIIVSLRWRRLTAVCLTHKPCSC